MRKKDYWKNIALGSAMMLISLLPIRAKSNSEIKVKHLTQINVIQKDTPIKGTVKDLMGPVIGASILIQGTTTGTITNIDGQFSLNNVKIGSKIIITFIGYKKQVIQIKNGQPLAITLIEDSQQLQELVIIGYGQQKKVNLTGSVNSIDAQKIAESRPITNISQALAGMAAGVSVTSSSNQPGDNNSKIRVRGQGTLNNSAPLVIIDGVQSDINSVNPQDIASMSILKDAASAAIYGSRAANGVILITTKKGQTGTIKIDYNGFVSRESIRKTLEPISNYADYMELINEGYENSNQSKKFSNESIEAWRNNNGKNPLLYPNTDWVDGMFSDATSQNHVLSLSGGSEKIHVYSSFGYTKNPGVMENSEYERFNARVNLDANVKPWLTLGVQANGATSTTESGVDRQKNVFTYASATTPGMVYRAPDGRYGAMNNSEDAMQSANNNPLRSLNQIAGHNKRDQFKARFYGTIKPLKGLSITGSFVYEYNSMLSDRKPVFLDGWNFQTDAITQVGKTKSYISNKNQNIRKHFSDGVVNYTNKFLDNRLDMKIMIGASQESYSNSSFYAKRNDLIDLSFSVLNGATGDSSTSGSLSDWTMRSYFSRLNLSWEDKYLVELNFRTDGSSRFIGDNRWGSFPSISAAWRLDQEEFMKGMVEKGLSSLKLRLSYGKLGNNSVGNYDAISVFALSNYSFNSTLATGLIQRNLANESLTWESTAVADIGVDFGILNNKLTGTFDFFNKETKDILINLPAPLVHGQSVIPKMNSATVRNRGLELSLNWQDNLTKDFSYSINGNVSYIKNKVLKYKGDERTINGSNIIQEGYSINSQYLLRVDRILQTDVDMKIVEDMVNNAPIDTSTGNKMNPFAAYGTPEKGDFLYKDTNNDGLVNDDDRVICSDGPNPKYLYGLNLSAQYKGIDFGILFQGQAGAKTLYRNDMNRPAVRIGYQLNKSIVEDRWFPGRIHATSPRLLVYNDTRNQRNSDYYLQNLAYLKIRNIQLGYTLPKRWVNFIQLEKVRVYSSLENYFTFTDFEGFDPEVTGLTYPTMKQAVIGINVSF